MEPKLELLGKVAHSRQANQRQRRQKAVLRFSQAKNWTDIHLKQSLFPYRQQPWKQNLKQKTLKTGRM